MRLDERQVLYSQINLHQIDYKRDFNQNGSINSIQIISSLLYSHLLEMDSINSNFQFRND